MKRERDRGKDIEIEIESERDALLQLQIQIAFAYTVGIHTSINHHLFWSHWHCGLPWLWLVQPIN